jgi:protein-histidine pros-kinase
MKLAGPLTVGQDKQLTTVESSAIHLLSLINDLLDLAKIESGNVELNMEPLTCQAVIEEVSTTLRTLAEGKNLKLEIVLPEHEINVRTDRRSLTQILINLTNNAIKFTQRGTVRLQLHEREENGELTADISVSDTGLGIRKEDQPKLFQAFTQVDNSSTRAYEGTGLGLHVSQKLALMIGGSISFESEYGRGSMFTVSLPLTQTIVAARKAQAGQ